MSFGDLCRFGVCPNHRDERSTTPGTAGLAGLRDFSGAFSRVSPPPLGSFLRSRLLLRFEQIMLTPTTRRPSNVSQLYGFRPGEGVLEACREGLKCESLLYALLLQRGMRL